MDDNTIAESQAARTMKLNKEIELQKELRAKAQEKVDQKVSDIHQLDIEIFHKNREQSVNTSKARALQDKSEKLDVMTKEIQWQHEKASVVLEKNKLKSQLDRASLAAIKETYVESTTYAVQPDLRVTVNEAIANKIDELKIKRDQLKKKFENLQKIREKNATELAKKNTEIMVLTKRNEALSLRLRKKLQASTSTKDLVRAKLNNLKTQESNRKGN